MPSISVRLACLTSALALACSPHVVAQQSGPPLAEAIAAAGNYPGYQNRISEAELQNLLNAATQSDRALRSAAEPLINRSRESGLSAYVETLGMVSTGQSALLEQMLQARYGNTPTATAVADKSGISTGWLLGGAAVVGIAAAAGGGGGGGGGGGSSAPADDPIIDKDPGLPMPPGGPLPPGDDPAPTPTDPDPTPDYGPEPGPEDPADKLLPLSDEHALTNGYNLTYGHVAHDRGFTGQGSRIAIIDSGVRSTHIELAGQIAGHFNVLTNETTAEASSDSGDHGTHVAGILAAKRNNTGTVGYAYGSQLLNVRFTNDNDEITASDQQLANGFAWARSNGARWFNNSWAIDATVAQTGRAAIDSAFPALLAEWRTGVADQRVYVWATGNGSLDQPLVFAALPALYPELKNHWLAVASVDSDTGVLSSFSNACGDAADWCLVAPGTDIVSSIALGDNRYGRFSGTSMATPAVTGALAVVSQAFPTLSSDQVAQRLLYTANKEGRYADTSLYGQGLLDLELATRPVGTLTVVSTSGTPLPVADSALVLGEPFGTANPLAGIQVMTTDQLSAGFAIDLGQLLTPRDFRYDSAQGFAQLSRSQTSETRGHQHLDRFSGEGFDDSLVMTLSQGSGQSLSIGQVADMDMLDGAQSWAGLSQLDASLASPFWLQQQNVQALAMRQRIPLGKVGVVEVTSAASALRHGLSVGLRAGTGPYSATIEAGYLQGRDGLFGSRGRGAFDLSSASRTLYTGIRGQLTLGALAFGHAAYIGKTQVDGGGLFSELDNVVSSSWLLSGGYSSGNQDWGLMLQQPLRVESANARINVATGYADNLFDMQSVSLNLAPDGRQVNLEAFWRKRLTGNRDIKLSWLGINEPGHQAGAESMQVLMGQWQQRF
ncbi:S8 family peptidase [Halopseudomonas sp.]|uniref:S8 family peptidase n=1 Tax=Halopseudomonas sp. TaxID=2901191 RepID=UPI003566BF82